MFVQKLMNVVTVQIMFYNVKYVQVYKIWGLYYYMCKG